MEYSVRKCDGSQIQVLAWVKLMCYAGDLAIIIQTEEETDMIPKENATLHDVRSRTTHRSRFMAKTIYCRPSQRWPFHRRCTAT